MNHLIQVKDFLGDILVVPTTLTQPCDEHIYPHEIFEIFHKSTNSTTLKRKLQSRKLQDVFLIFTETVIITDVTLPYVIITQIID